MCNIMLPKIANDLKREQTVFGGWLSSLANEIENVDSITLSVCFPITKTSEIIHGHINKISYYGFPSSKFEPHIYDKETENYLKSIIDDFEPDIVHIWGTEFPHSLSLIKVFNSPNKTVISIQGLVSIYKMHYYSNLSFSTIKSLTLRDFLKRDNIKKQSYKYSLRGNFEIDSLKNIKYTIGRTTWDKACIEKINPKINYFYCNETLREQFYLKKWDISKCIKHSIFVSQANNPIKGFHNLLEALPDVIKKFPDTHIYTTGVSPIEILSFSNRIKLTSYQKYLRNKIRSLKLESYITFLGTLNENEICDRYLKSHVFVLPSSIENSPNSLGEAMILGVPCIASYVGGVPDMLLHNIDGFLYQYDAPYMLSYYINRIFENNDLAVKFSNNSRIHALETHNTEKNTNRIIEIYNEIYQGY